MQVISFGLVYHIILSISAGLAFCSCTFHSLHRQFWGHTETLINTNGALLHICSLLCFEHSSPDAIHQPAAPIYSDINDCLLVWKKGSASSVVFQCKCATEQFFTPFRKLKVNFNRPRVYVSSNCLKVSENSAVWLHQRFTMLWKAVVHLGQAKTFPKESSGSETPFHGINKRPLSRMCVQRPGGANLSLLADLFLLKFYLQNQFSSKASLGKICTLQAS